MDQEFAPPSPARQALDALPWIGPVARETRDLLVAQAMLHRLPAGAMAFDQAEAPAFAQIVVSGAIKLVGVRQRDESVIEIVRPFEWVLPAAVITGQPYLLRARVLEDAQILLIPAARFREALAQDSAFSGAVLQAVARQLRRQLRAAKSFRMRTAEERVAAYVAALAGDSAELTLPMEKSEIAAHLGMTRETFSRTLAALAKHGVGVDGRKLAIADPAAFRARFPYDPFIDGDDS